MSQETKEEIASHIGAINEWLKAFLRNIARRQVEEGQGRSLMNCVKEAFHTAFKAVTECFRFICETVRQGWLKLKEGVRWVVQEVKELVRCAVSCIRQLFQMDVSSGYALWCQSGVLGSWFSVGFMGNSVEAVELYTFMLCDICKIFHLIYMFIFTLSFGNNNPW